MSMEVRWISYFTASMVSPVDWEWRRSGKEEERRRKETIKGKDCKTLRR